MTKEAARNMIDRSSPNLGWMYCQQNPSIHVQVNSSDRTVRFEMGDSESEIVLDVPQDEAKDLARFLTNLPLEARAAQNRIQNALKELALIDSFSEGERFIADRIRAALLGPDVAPKTASPVSRDPENGGGDLSARLLDVVMAAHAYAVEAAEIVDAVLAAGWRPGAEQLTREDRRGLAAVFGYELGEDEARRQLLADGWRPPLPDRGQDLAEHVASAITDALATHPWDGGDHSNHPLSVFAEVAMAAVMPFLEEPPARRVFFPGDTVPAGFWISYCTPNGGLAAAMGAEDWMAMDGVVVELSFPSLAEWQAAVARASAEREQSTSDTTGQEDGRG